MPNKIFIVYFKKLLIFKEICIKLKLIKELSKKSIQTQKIIPQFYNVLSK
jgi:hypothetical protein